MTVSARRCGARSMPIRQPPQPDTKRIHPLILVVVNAFLVVVSLAALFGIWFGRTGRAAA